MDMTNAPSAVASAVAATVLSQLTLLPQSLLLPVQRGAMGW